MMDLLIAGLRITAIGMGLVFLLLAMMWALLVLLLKMDRPPAQGAPAGAVDAPEEADAAARELAAAITVAVMTHQAVRRKQAAPAMRTHWPGTLPSRWVGVGRSRQTRSWIPDRR